jgi:hypothetical protein
MNDSYAHAHVNNNATTDRLTLQCQTNPLITHLHDLSLIVSDPTLLLVGFVCQIP